MKKLIITATTVLLIWVGFGPSNARAQGYVGSSDIQWVSGYTLPINIFDPAAVTNLLVTHKIAIMEVNYFTPGLPGGPANTYTGVANTGFVNSYAVLHDYNTHGSPFGGFAGFVDIITPLAGITHGQIGNLFTFNSSGVARAPQVSSFDPYISDSFRNTHVASGYGAYPASYDPSGEGYATVPSSFVPLPPARGSQCGTLRTDDVMRRNTALYSCNGRYALVLNLYGNLLFSDVYAGKLLWATNWGGPVSTHYAFVMQPDGEAVLYRWNWSRVVASGTAGHHGATVRVTDDGHLEIRNGSTLVARYY